jgi:MFS superfamily sulfate permease-like transporter
MTSTEVFVVTVVATVVAGILLAVLGLLWRNRSRPAHWVTEQVEVAKQSDLAEAADQLDVLREQVMEVARLRDVVVPATSAGRNPTVVTFSNGAKSYFFADFASYKREMEARRVPPHRSFRTDPPLPVSRWDRDRLEQWMADHAD